jgi:hypothetical protein
MLVLVIVIVIVIERAGTVSRYAEAKWEPRLSPVENPVMMVDTCSQSRYDAAHGRS